ncbi:lipid A biosynthesis acyltransferase [Mucilaginibacter rubeus]|uniref:Lipid A biosynthesis acyltransferase n=1 Tax=Mucilaginibacter rubeus TaxID=2027860 RepID=A0A5C1I591_9SPHI|nr:lipid A biosynthesis acyltransferase [Mucilaginibacter rubeus]QEM13073.1 lipid A biosynthesis acyltransferase [Mucilaginibacter rubeus]
MPAWQGKSKGNTLGYRIFVSVLKTAGVMPAYFMLRFVALYYFLFSWQTSKGTYYYFHKRLGYGKVKSIFKLYRNYYLFGQSIIDKVVIMSGIPNKFTFNFDGIDNLRQIAAMNKGGLLLSSHIGSWEIAGELLDHINTRINIVMFDGEDRQIKQYMDSVTGERKINIIVIKNDLSHIFRINAAFQNNELVCMHADRYIEGNKTITREFLGEDAKFPAGPFVMAEKFKVPVTFVYALKESALHYHFFSSPVKDYSDLPRGKGMEQLADDFITSFENKVKTYPEQWYNYYNFWQ